MARESAAVRRDRAYYSSYGSVAYQPEYEEDVQSVERRQAQPRQRPRIQPRERVARRPVVAVRQQSPVSLFALVGFIAVAAAVFMMLTSAIQLAVVADQTITLQNELAQLQSDEKKLLSQYEQAYDLSAIEREMTSTGTMMRAGAVDTVYLDLAAEDSVIYYSSAAEGISGLVDRMENAVQELLSKRS